MKPRVLHLGLETGSQPTWVPYDGGGLGTVEPATLPLSPRLVKELNDWAEDYDKTIGAAIAATGHSPPKSSPDTLRLHASGLELWRQVVAALGDEYEVHYDSPIHGQSYRVHHPSEQ